MQHTVYELEKCECPYFKNGACLKSSPPLKCNLQRLTISFAGGDFEDAAYLWPYMPMIPESNGVRITTCGGTLEVVKKIIERDDRELIAILLTSDSEPLRRIAQFHLNLKREQDVEAGKKD